MFNRLGNIVSAISRFMAGRNGFDKLSGFLLLLYLITNGMNSFIRGQKPSTVLYVISSAFIILALFRMLSKNTVKRQQENNNFTNFLKAVKFDNPAYKVKEKAKVIKLKSKFSGTHRFRKCPECGELLRLSKKRGKREIICPKCGGRVKFWIWI